MSAMVAMVACHWWPAAVVLSSLRAGGRPFVGTGETLPMPQTCCPWGSRTTAVGFTGIALPNLLMPPPKASKTQKACCGGPARSAVEGEEAMAEEKMEEAMRVGANHSEVTSVMLLGET